jgi:hypothetical protein
MEKLSKKTLWTIGIVGLLFGAGLYYFVIRKKPAGTAAAPEASTSKTGAGSGSSGGASSGTAAKTTTQPATPAAETPKVELPPVLATILKPTPAPVPISTAIKAEINQSQPVSTPAPVVKTVTPIPAPAPVVAQAPIVLPPSMTPVTPAVVKTVTTPSVPAPAPTPTSMPAGVAKMLRAVEDSTQHKAILRVTPKNLFAVGNTVKVSGSVYNGSFKIWYIYKAHATEDALYIETPFKGTDVGTVTK